MKMDFFPDTVRIKVLDDTAGRLVPNIAVKINIFAKYKNNYNFILPISDNHGIIEITKDWLNQEINKISSLLIMDYSSSLTDCEPKFEFRICSTEEVNRALKAQIFYKNSLDITQKFIDQLSLVDNFKYQPLTQMIELHGEKIIEVELKLNKAK